METDNLNSIQDLIAEKEGGKVEFKQTTGQLERRHGNAVRLPQR